MVSRAEQRTTQPTCQSFCEGFVNDCFWRIPNRFWTCAPKRRMRSGTLRMFRHTSPLRMASNMAVPVSIDASPLLRIDKPSIDTSTGDDHRFPWDGFSVETVASRSSRPVTTPLVRLDICHSICTLPHHQLYWGLISMQAFISELSPIGISGGLDMSGSLGGRKLTQCIGSRVDPLILYSGG